MEMTVARMPLGDPKSVPDPEGELYDAKMAELRAHRVAKERAQSPLDAAGQVIRGFQDGPRIPRPNVAETFIPVVGPAWEALGDLQDGNYAGAALNGGMAAADLIPGAVLIKGVRAASKGIGLVKKGSVTANAAAKMIRARGLAGAGDEVHHTVALKGLSRTAQDVRNHYPLLKVLPKEQHRRLTGSWNGKPRYDPVRRLWYGTTDWMKAGPLYAAGHTATAAEQGQHDRPR